MANEVTNFNIGGVDHPVQDDGARQLIAQLQAAIDAITSGDTTNLVTFTQLNNTLSSYATKNYVDQAVQQAEQGETVVINSDGANIVDGQSDSILTAPSSRMVKEIYLNLQKLFDPVNGLAGIAFVGTRPTWQSVAIPTHTITLGTMSNVTATYNGTALPATNVNEGEVTIVLTPAAGTALADSDIHITIGGKEVRFTRSGNNVTFVLSGDATVAATAFEGITVNAPAAGSNFTIDKSSVHINSAGQTLELTPNEHCSWGDPVNVVVTYGGDNITNQCSIVESGGKQVITLPALSDGSKAITVTASAVVNQHITVTFPSNHTNMIIKHGNSELTGDSVVVYSDMLNYAITFQAKDGHRFDDVPSVGGTALTGSGGIYTLTVDSVSADITVVATTEQIPVHTLTINTARMSGCHIEYNGNEMTPTNNVVTIGNIADGSNVSFRVVPDAGYALQSLSYTVNSISQQTTNINGTGETIAINNVTSDVTVVVTATASTTNYMFKNANYYKGKLYIPQIGRDQKYPGAYANDSFVISPIIDIEGKNNLSFHIGDGNTGSVVYFNDKVSDYAGYKDITNETLSGGSGDVSNAKSIRLCIPKDPSVVYSSWVKSGDAYLFKGIDFVEESNGEYTFKSNVKNGWELFNSDYIKRSQSELEEEVYLHYQVYATTNTGLPPTLFYESTGATFLSKWVHVNNNDVVKFATGHSHEDSSGFAKYGLCLRKKNTNGDDVFGAWQQNTNSLNSNDFREVTIADVPDDGAHVCVIGPLVDNTVPVAYIEVNGAAVWQSKASKQSQI